MQKPSPRYKGYHSFDYLEPEVDYRVFDLAQELGRVPEYELGLDEEQAARVTRLLAENHVVSLHEHLKVTTKDPHQLREYNRTGRNVLGFEGVARSGMSTIFENFMNGSNVVTSENGWKWSDIIQDLGLRLADIAKQDYLVLVRDIEELEAAKANGQVGIVAALEAATQIENELDRIDVLYGFGVRQMGLVYSMANQLGSGLAEPQDGGLTAFGRRAVERMNKLGMAIDVSHCSDRTSLDAIHGSSGPVLITHAGARGLWPTPRMKPDDVITAMAERGGVIGLEAAPHTTVSPQHLTHSLDSVMDHFQYCVDLVGIDHVGFGPDTHFGDHVGLHGVFAKQLATRAAHLGSVAPEFPHVEYVAGMENPAENFTNITGWLVKHGYSDEDIIKVIGGNALRVLKEVW